MIYQFLAKSAVLLGALYILLQIAIYLIPLSNLGLVLGSILFIFVFLLSLLIVLDILLS